jgi:THO complex subunit 3
MESREEERKGSGGSFAAISTPGMNLKNLVSREYFGHKKKVNLLCVLAILLP